MQSLILTSHIMKRLHFVCFVSSPIPSLLLMVKRNPLQAVWCHLVLSRCTMVSEVKRRGVQESKNIDYAKQHHTPHCWLPAKVMYPANSTKRFSWLTRSTSMSLMKNVQIYHCSMHEVYYVDKRYVFDNRIVLLNSNVLMWNVHCIYK